MQKQHEQPDNLLVIDIETKPNKGQDAHLYLSYLDSFVLAVFDGLGGRSGMMGSEHGARVASRSAKTSTYSFFQDLINKHQKLDKTNAFDLQRFIQQDLRKSKNDYERTSNKPSSRIKSNLKPSKDIASTTLALANISKSRSSQKALDLDVAWIGDSRVYFLSSRKGLQQLTQDDVKEYKDDFDSVSNSGAPMTQYLTPDMDSDVGINFNHFSIEEPGLVIVSTDGAFDGLHPWYFEYLLLFFLQSSGSMREYEQKLSEYLRERRVGDDITLILQPLAFGNNFSSIQEKYQERYRTVEDLANSCRELKNYAEVWNKYRVNYEERIEQTASQVSNDSIALLCDSEVINELIDIDLDFNDPEQSISKKSIQPPRGSQQFNEERAPLEQPISYGANQKNPQERINELGIKESKFSNQPNYQNPSLDIDNSPSQNTLPPIQPLSYNTNQDHPSDISKTTNRVTAPSEEPNTNVYVPDQKKQAQPSNPPYPSHVKNKKIDLLAKASGNKISTHCIDYIYIAKGLLYENKDYNSAIQTIIQILKSNCEEIPALSFLGLAYFMESNSGVLAPLPKTDKWANVFRQTLNIIEKKKYLEKDSQHESIRISLIILVECLTQVEISSKVFSSSELKEIEAICRKIKTYREQNPHPWYVTGKIYAAQSKTIQKKEEKNYIEQAKKDFRYAQNIYEQRGDTRRVNECNKEIKKLDSVWNKRIF
ncbi:protein phosphatase 2C domain protein [[Leptolyngbya] sp. PCC 7376]|uniref:protein phosphatase 2C domain-containing protein n=1 Tax=[Leptolyngbya] sp. PCC 7376 TaxID=111781 RepID=UPI00029F42C5|nr:protein phosphatase 2C domain-containing protein [[Leptolyngbya] sp. PCC 7376]AFY38205.1 protein phosphatase 2C domain protein [[Leptolyngbya] sp. PCC 7376]